MSDQKKQQQFEDKEEGILSMEGTEWSLKEEENIVGHGNAKQKEMTSKIALLLEVNNL
jgi:hypothetical protein